MNHNTVPIVYELISIVYYFKIFGLFKMNLGRLQAIIGLEHQTNLATLGTVCDTIL